MEPSQNEIFHNAPAQQFDIEAISRGMRPIDQVIKTWISIAKNEKIDVTEESINFIKLLNKFDTGETTEIKEFWKDIAIEKKIKFRKKSKISSFVDPLEVVLIAGFKQKFSEDIIRKVKMHLQRNPTEEALKIASSKLKGLTSIWSGPWIKIAKAEGIDIKEEYEVLSNAQQSSLEAWKEPNQFPKNILEVSQIRLTVLHRECTLRIIHKVFESRIKREAEKAKQRLADESSVIDGIANEFLASLPKSQNLSSMLTRCHRIYTCFKQNISLLENHPKAYFYLADRKWLKNEVEKRFDLLMLNPKTQKPILACKEIMLKLLETNKPIDTIIHHVNKAFKWLGEKIFTIEQIGNCGYGEIKRSKR